jgi:hypothetical protein
MEDQIKKRSAELNQQYNVLGKQLQELVAQKMNIEQQIGITRENMLQIKGAHAELTALLGTPELPTVATGKRKPTRTTVGKKKGAK